MHQGFQQPGVVALVQADRRLVQHIEHAGQAGADLRGEPDALAFAARQCARGARQVEIIEPHIDEELQPLADFLEDARGDFLVLGLQLGQQFVEPLIGLADRHFRNLADVLAVDLHRQRLRLQPVAVAFAARMIRLEARQLLAHPLRVGLAPAPLDVADHAFEGLLGLVGADAVVIGDRDFLLAGAEEHGVAGLLRQILPRRGHRELVVLGQRFQRLGIIGRGVAGLGPGHDWRHRAGSASHPAPPDRARISVPCPARRISGRRRRDC